MRPAGVNVFRETTPTGWKSKRDMNATGRSTLFKRTHFYSVGNRRAISMRPVKVNFFEEITPTSLKSKKGMNAASWSKLIKRNFSDRSKIEENYKGDQLVLMF